jgi:hypothetical protein
MKINEQIDLILSILKTILPKEFKEGHHTRIMIDLNCSSIRDFLMVKKTEKGWEVFNLK